VPRLFIAVFVIAALTPVVAQNPVPRFEVASIRKSPSPAGSMRINLGSRQGDRWRAQNATLRLLLRNGYPQFSMQGQIAGGPGWMDTDRFDIEATMGPETSNGDMRTMIRSLLAERLKLKVHIERRELPVFVLETAEGNRNQAAQMRPVAIDCDAVRAARANGEAPVASPGGAIPCSTSMALGPVSRIETTGMNMATPAQTVSSESGRPVFDRTGLAGWFECSRFAAEPGGTRAIGTEDRVSRRASRRVDHRQRHSTCPGLALRKADLKVGPYQLPTTNYQLPTTG
jgi:uncharacterized protein (TIGR03435 family)